MSPQQKPPQQDYHNKDYHNKDNNNKDNHDENNCSFLHFLGSLTLAPFWILGSLTPASPWLLHLLGSLTPAPTIPRNLDPTRHTNSDALKAHIITFEALLEEEEEQIRSVLEEEEQIG